MLSEEIIWMKSGFEEDPQSILPSSQTNKWYQRVKKSNQPRRQKWPNKRNTIVSEVQSCVSLPWCIIPPHLCSYWWKNSGDQWSFSWNIKEIITIFFLLSFTTILVKGRSYSKMIARINGFPATLIDWISPKFDLNSEMCKCWYWLLADFLRQKYYPVRPKHPCPWS